LTAAPALSVYEGVVTHVRFAPRRHRLRYSLFLMRIDIDGLEQEAGRLKLFSHNRFNLFSFHDKDHGPGGSLRAWIEGHLSAAGLSPDGGRIEVLCLPRVLGYVFNPISVWFCWRKDGALNAILYEVRNTFGETHAYLIPAPQGNKAVVEQTCDKRFFVSPFMDMDLAYRFRVLPPAEATVLDIHVTKQNAALLTARFAGQRTDVTDRSLRALLLRYPLVTLKVMAGIYWEAIKILAKGIWLRPRPKPPPTPVTYVTAPM
jgi:DUF1365 family protein